MMMNQQQSWRPLLLVVVGLIATSSSTFPTATATISDETQQDFSCYDQAPFDCPEATFCTSWNDGCNECGCDPTNSQMSPFCTFAYCFCYDDNSCVPSCNDNDQCVPRLNTVDTNGNSDISAMNISSFNTTSSSDGYLRIIYQYGFFEDDLTPMTGITREDVEGVVCQTQAYLSRVMADLTNPDIVVVATEIDWGYFQDQDLPAQINLTVSYLDSFGIPVDDSSLYNEILLETFIESLSELYLQKFIAEWVWQAEPVELNYFVNANRMSIDATIIDEYVVGMLDQVECPATAELAASRLVHHGDDIQDALP